MGKFNQKRNGHKRVPIMFQPGIQSLIRGLLKQPFDVSMACLIVLVDVDPTISEMKDVKDFMNGLTHAEQEYAVMLEAALQANKVQKTRMQEAVDEYNRETAVELRIGDAATDEGFAAWLPGYNDKLQAKWREEHPDEAAAYDAQMAQQKAIAADPHYVNALQATDPQGDVSEFIPRDDARDTAVAVAEGWDVAETSVPDADMPAPLPAEQADTNSC